MALFNRNALLPCVAFFAQGRVMFGFIVLLMQLSLVFWPAASRLARDLNERSGVEKLLAELSETHRVPVDPYSQPAKKFRQLA